MHTVCEGDNMTILKIICAWCGQDLGFKDGKGTEGISHGICANCRDKEFIKIDRLKRLQ